MPTFSPEEYIRLNISMETEYSRCLCKFKEVFTTALSVRLYRMFAEANFSYALNRLNRFISSQHIIWAEKEILIHRSLGATVMDRLIEENLPQVRKSSWHEFSDTLDRHEFMDLNELDTLLYMQIRQDSKVFRLKEFEINSI